MRRSWDESRRWCVRGGGRRVGICRWEVWERVELSIRSGWGGIELWSRLNWRVVEGGMVGWRRGVVVGEHGGGRSSCGWRL